MAKEIKNAIIESVSLDNGDRGLLTAWIHLDYGDGGHQGFGGYALYLPKDYQNHTLLSHAGHFIFRCMEIADVSSWDKIKGKSVRVHIEDGRIKGIGHITKKDWFYPESEFKS